MRSLMAAVSVVTVLGMGVLGWPGRAEARRPRRTPPPPPAETAAPAADVAPPPAADGAAATPSAAPTTPRAAEDPQQPRFLAPLKHPDLDHKLQFGLAVMPGIGYRTIFPYQENVGCGQTAKRVCSGHLPFFIDIQPSFGIAIHWDLLVDLRFGVEQDFTHSRQFAVAPGFRYWVDPLLPVKFFATVQVAYDATAQGNGLLKHNNDVAFRNSNAIMFEVMRNFGIYIQAGETIGFVRWLRFEIDLGLGFQARVP